MHYQGRFKPKYPQKYIGDPTNIIYRSGWELNVMFWCDKNKEIIGWCSEDIKVPYKCPTDNKFHRYFVDFLIKFKNETTILVELKPERQTRPPILKTKKPTKKFIEETFVYVKNQAKWKAANLFAQKHNWSFMVWTEKTLKELGIDKAQDNGHKY